MDFYFRDEQAITVLKEDVQSQYSLYVAGSSGPGPWCQTKGDPDLQALRGAIDDGDICRAQTAMLIHYATHVANDASQNSRMQIQHLSVTFITTMKTLMISPTIRGMNSLLRPFGTHR